MLLSLPGRKACSRSGLSEIQGRENLPMEVVVDLRAIGHEADSVSAEGLVGAADQRIRDRARSEGRALFTLDKGLADIRAYPPRDSSGVVLFRPASSGKGAVLSFVRRHLAAVLALEVTGRLVIVSERGIRVR